jgi:hypothetical protein
MSALVPPGLKGPLRFAQDAERVDPQRFISTLRRPDEESPRSRRLGATRIAHNPLNYRFERNLSETCGS